MRQPAEYKIRLVNKEDMEMAPNEIKGTLAANQSLYLPFFIRLPLSRWQEKRNLDLELEIQFQEKGEWVKRPFKSHIVGP